MKQLEFSTLRIFVAVAEEGSLSGAAEKVHLAIAAVSKRITDLEASSGAALFLRHARGVSLTPAGHALLQHAREILFRIDQMQSDLHQYTPGMKGQLRIASIGTALSQFLPTDLSHFSRAHPNVVIELSELRSTEVIDGVRDGRFDIGIFAATTPHDGLATYPYHSDELCVVVPGDHPLAGRASVRFVDTLEYPYIGQPLGSSLLNTLLAHSAMRLKVRFHVRSGHIFCRMVHEGLGIGVMPAQFTQPHAASMNIRALRLDESWARREIYVGARSEQGLSAPAQEFIGHLRTPDAMR
ncbi:LysR family transcriptional regulator [Pigmentiphaga soli]|uniref:LysR family transcriptional regulator n=1 Tax=Pigmentiphaga soli TaxID=1007095 RepID=A0ABP8GQ58_9BURK